ncbi:hypothetical protein DFH09DRAFT_1087063 [Mycena vulgaris]|nr:hypothetical protein DFH09DRAFT_1087063 [Mycena vulgaris]
MREHLTQIQLEQDALAQPQTPPRVPPCAGDDVPMVNSNSTVVRPRFWLASILNPALGALTPSSSQRSARKQLVRTQPSQHPIPLLHPRRMSAPPRQPSRHTGAALPRRRLPAHRGRCSTTTEQRSQESPHAPRPTRALPRRIRARHLHQLRPREAPRLRPHEDPHLHLLPRHKQKPASSVPQRPLPHHLHLRHPTFAVRARVRRLPSVLRVRGAWVPTAPARRPDYARPHGFIVVGVDSHPFIDTGAHRIVEADPQMPRDGRGLRAYLHPIVAATEHGNRFAYSPHAFTAMDAYDAHTLAAHSTAQRESTFAYNPHAFTAVAARAHAAYGLAPVSHAQHDSGFAHTPHIHRAGTDAHGTHALVTSPNGQREGGFVYSPHPNTYAPGARVVVAVTNAPRDDGLVASRRRRGRPQCARYHGHIARMVRARLRRHGCAAVLRACPGLLPASYRRSPAPARKVDERRRGGGGLSRVLVANHAFSWAHGGVADAGAVWTDEGEGAEHPRVLVVGEAEEGFASDGGSGGRGVRGRLDGVGRLHRRLRGRHVRMHRRHGDAPRVRGCRRVLSVTAGRKRMRRVRRRRRAALRGDVRRVGVPVRGGPRACACVGFGAEFGMVSDGRALAWPGSRGFGPAWSGFGSINYQAGPPHLALAWPGLALA